MSLFDNKCKGKIEKLDVSKIVMQEINARTTQKIVSKYHYSHSCPPPLISLGFFITDEEANRNGELCTVIAYTEGANRHAPYALFEDSSHLDMLELVRLFSFDWAPKNIESYCIGQSIQWIKDNAPQKKWLVSYADLNEGHIGGIYQATNWIYTGLGAKGKRNITLDGKQLHTRTMWSDAPGGIEAAKEFYAARGQTLEVNGNLLPKARYIYLLGNKKEKRMWLSKIKVPIFDKYPKSYEEALEMEKEKPDELVRKVDSK